ncbi:MAG: class I SAM-dependent methyltransferase [Faecalibacillus faecis]
MSYEAFAYYYDSLMDQEFYNDYIQFINEHVKDYQTVLELGCGTGEIAIRLAHLGKQVCATDISKDMLEVANTNVLILKWM